MLISIFWRNCVNQKSSGQSFKRSIIVNYNSKVTLTRKLPNSTTLESQFVSPSCTDEMKIKMLPK